MDRRGVTPLVATILLIALAVILAAIIFFWARGFLSESAQKGERAVEISCAGVEFEAEVVQYASECQTPSSTIQNPQYYSAIDINNVGTIPIYGVQVLEYDDTAGNINIEPLADQPFLGGTVTVGKSSYACLNRVVANQDAFRIVPKLLAEHEGKKIVYTCPEKDGITIAYVGV